MITQTQEDYLRAIYILKEKGEKYPSVSEIAKHLNLSRSTVWERLQTLSKRNLIKKGIQSSVRLTEKGNNLARKLTWKHRVIEVFLHDFLGLESKQVHEEAHKLEHAFSDELIERLSQKLNNPQICPHGSKILGERYTEFS